MKTRSVVPSSGRIAAMSSLLVSCTLSLTAEVKDHPLPDEARIAEIATYISEEPSAPGCRITDRAAWGRYSGTAEARSIMERAADIAAHDVPDMPPVWYLEWFTTDYIKEGDSRRWRNPFWRRASNLSTLLLAECLENKGRFMKRIIQYLEFMQTECAWTEPAHDRRKTVYDGSKYIVDLGVAERCTVLAYTLDWLKDRIPVATRNRVIAEIRKRAFEPYLDGGENWSNNNWNPVCNGCVARAALALEPDRRTRARFIEAVERTIPYFLRGFRKDGYCGEGLDYWNYGYGRFLPLVLDIRRVTGGKVDLGALPRAREAMLYAYGFQLEPYLAPRFADGMANSPSSRNLALGRLVWPDISCDRGEKVPLMVASFDNLAFRSFDGESIRRHGLAHPPLVLPIRSWFPDAQLYLGRPAAKEGQSLSACVKGGWNNDPHNHNDVGTYVVMVDGVEMVSDPGGEEYTKRTFSPRRYESKILNSYGHPVPVVAGKLQKPGWKYFAKVLDTSFSDAADSVTLDLSAAYGLGKEVKVVRTFGYGRADKTVTVTDSAEFATPSEFETGVITFTEVERTDRKDVFYLVNGKPARRVRMTVSVKGGDWDVREETLENPKRREPTRLGIFLKNPVKTAEITVKYEVCQPAGGVK